ncbi:hypothetical protein CsSME_00047985 [Camellia sinensis var. sinensis]
MNKKDHQPPWTFLLLLQVNQNQIFPGSVRWDYCDVKKPTTSLLWPSSETLMKMVVMMEAEDGGGGGGVDNPE